MFHPAVIPPRLTPVVADEDSIFSTSKSDRSYGYDDSDQLQNSLFFNKASFNTFDIETSKKCINNQLPKLHQTPNETKPDRRDPPYESLYAELLCSLDPSSVESNVPPSWEYFSTGNCPPPEEYLLEQSLSQFESSLPVLEALSDTYSRPSAPISPAYFIKCLTTVICGQQSRLFLYDPKKHIFYASCSQGISECRFPGLSSEVTSSIVQTALDAGSRMVRLKYTCKFIYESADKSNDANDSPVSVSSIHIALADNITRILYAIESHIINDTNLSGNDTPSILSCYNLIQEPIKIINMTAVLLGCSNISVAQRLKRLPSSWTLLNALYSRCLRFQDGDASNIFTRITNTTTQHSINDLFTSSSMLYHLFRSMLHNCASQWLNKLDEYVGLGPSSIGSKTLTSPATYSPDIDIFLEIDTENSSFKSKPTKKQALYSSKEIFLYTVNPSKVPYFMSLEIAQTCADIANCLVLISNYSTKNESIMHSAFLLQHSNSSGNMTLLEMLQNTLGANKPHLSWSVSFQELEMKDQELLDYAKKANFLLQLGNDQDIHAAVNESPTTAPRLNSRSVTFESESELPSRANNELDETQNQIIPGHGSNESDSSMSEEDELKMIAQKNVDKILSKTLKSPVTFHDSSTSTTVDQNNDSSDFDNSSGGVNPLSSQIPLHVLNTFSISSVISFQSKFLHRLLFRNIYGSGNQSQLRDSSSHFESECSLLDHMKLLHGIMFLSSGEMVVSLEDMLFGQDLSFFSVHFRQTRSTQPHETNLLETTDIYEGPNEAELSQFGPFGSLKLCTNPYLLAESQAYFRNKRNKTVSQWPPGTPHIHYALSSCVDRAVGLLGISETVRKQDFLNVGVRSLSSSSASSSFLSNSWSITPKFLKKKWFMALPTIQRSSRLTESGSGFILKKERRWMYPKYCLAEAEENHANNYSNTIFLSSHPKFALGATYFLKMAYLPPALIGVIVTRKLIHGCYEKVFSWLVQLLHVRRVVKDIHYTLTINARKSNTQEAVDSGDVKHTLETAKAVYSTASLCWQLVSMLYLHCADRVVNNFWSPWIQKLESSITSSSHNDKESLTLNSLIKTHEQTVSTICNAMFIQTSWSTSDNETLRVRELLELLLQTVLDFCCYVSLNEHDLYSQYHEAHAQASMDVRVVNRFQTTIKNVVFRITKELNKMRINMAHSNDSTIIQQSQLAEELGSNLERLL